MFQFFPFRVNSKKFNIFISRMMKKLIQDKDILLKNHQKDSTKVEIKESKTAKDNASNIKSKDDYSPKSKKSPDVTNSTNTEDFVYITLNYMNIKLKSCNWKIKLTSSLNYFEKSIKSQLKTKDEVVFKYKSNGSMIPIETTRKISEIKDLIQETRKDGKEEYILYVYFEPKPKKDNSYEDKTERIAIKNDDEIKEKKKTRPESKNSYDKSPKKTPKSPRRFIKTKEVNSDDEDKTKVKKIDDSKTNSGIMRKTRKETDPELKLPIDSLPPETETKKLNQDKNEAIPSKECILINLILTGCLANNTQNSS